MPEKPTEVEGVAIPASQVAEMMRVLLQEARKPVIDPIKEKQKQRMREHNKELQKDALQVKLNKFHNCNHMQRPGSAYNGCSAIAWATQSDGITRGPCQHCGTFFSPKKEECISEEVWEAYKHFIRIPTHPAGHISIS